MWGCREWDVGGERDFEVGGERKDTRGTDIREMRDIGGERAPNRVGGGSEWDIW